ncbi:Hypothetical predicted protein [Octopus vulgaris]|uniref:Uncharacterized protein n=1 Tax=Octopus vulgaris TaxID=6645 RepID=A0AA36F9N5_OCTVU|nr:Hypothetical predicted protein [Octopus vulgaris]
MAADEFSGFDDNEKTFAEMIDQEIIDSVKPLEQSDDKEPAPKPKPTTKDISKALNLLRYSIEAEDMTTENLLLLEKLEKRFNTIKSWK